MSDNGFITPKKWEEIKKEQISGPNGWLLFVACNSGEGFAKNVKKCYSELLEKEGDTQHEVPLFSRDEEGNLITKIFEDTETRPRLPENVDGANAFIFQSLDHMVGGDSINENLVQLYQMIRALKEHGAQTITAVTPYSAYSRQDKTTLFEREPINAKLHADFQIEAGVNQVVVYHPHTYSIKGFYAPRARLIPISGMDLFIDVFEDFKSSNEVIAVSTDAGGAKFTIHHANAMALDYGITAKYRPIEQNADTVGTIGYFEGKRIALLTDDESVTFGTILSACKELHTNKNIEEIHIAISHNKVTSKGLARLHEAHERYGLKTYHTTNTIQIPRDLEELDFVHISPLEKLFCNTINRLHYNQSVSSMFYKPANRKS